MLGKNKLSWVTLILFSALLLGGCGGSGDGGSDATSTPNLTLTAVFAQQPTPANSVPTATNPEDPYATPQPTATATIVPDAKGAFDSVIAPEQQPTFISAVTVTPRVLDYSGAAVSGSTTARSGASIAAEFLENPPTIDGDIGDWPGTIYGMGEVVYGPGYYANSLDLFGEFKIAWDEQYLYIGVIVRDTKFVQNADGYYIYLGDSLEILFDTDLAGDYASETLSSDDFQIGFSPGDLRDNNPGAEGYLWYPKDKAGTLSNAQIGGWLTDDGYMMEVALPWTVLGVTPLNGQTFGFLFSVSDNDSVTADEQHTMVSFAPGRKLLDPTTWRTLILSGK